MKSLVSIIAMMSISLSVLTAQAQIEDCNSSAKGLYKDIVVYRETEKIKPTKGFVGSRLKYDLSFMKNSNLSLQDKIQSLETGFARCYVRLSQAEELSLLALIDSALAEIDQAQ